MPTSKEFGIRLKKIRTDKNFSLRQAAKQSQLGEYPALSASYWSIVENGEKNIPKPDTLRRFAKGLRVEPNEILSLAGYIEATDNFETFEKEDMVSIPIVGTIKAGTDGLALSDYSGYSTLSINDLDNEYDYFWLKVKGDSMIGDGIFDGDLALIKKTSEFTNGNICAVIIDGEEGTLKHIKKDETSIVLSASNPAYSPRVFIGNDMKEIYVAGKLVQTKRIFNN